MCMNIIKENSELQKYFLSENFVSQQVYNSKQKYTPIYVNPILYEELFDEKYNEERAFKKISNIFSITLNKDNSTNEKGLGNAFADKQEDPMGISLSGNLGSGRSFFYGKCFNIKGDKTSLATSKKEIYSNGKFSLAAGIKETIFSNILSKELSVPSFETLAILDTNDTFEFVSEYLDSDDTIKEERYILPSVIEIRVNKDKRLYRISNAFINEDKFTFDELKDLCKKLGHIEAEKICNRFLHGSWSVGNISIDANLIDFDTASFVVGRNPQYSNTNKYKSNYFGFEILGSQTIIQLLIENASKCDDNQKRELNEFLLKEYNKHLKINFCNLLGLDYNNHYDKYIEYIDDLFEKFMTMSKKFLPNYYDLNVLEKNCNNTFIYNFSNFFQNYLVQRGNNESNIILGLKLLLNETYLISYKKVGFIKEKVEEFFSEFIVSENDNSSLLSDAINFINKYDEFFNIIKIEEQFDDIKFKQFIINMNRSYLYGNEQTFAILSDLYLNKQIDNLTLNKIINNLINTNIRKFNNNQKEYMCNLQLYDNYLSYMIVSKNYYQMVLVPYSNFNMRFAKLIFEDEEYMFQYQSCDSNYEFISEKIFFDDLNSIIDSNIEVKVNGKNNYKKLTLTK